MKAVFIDTSAFYALFNREDPNHEKAVLFYRQEAPLFTTTSVVFTELLSLLTKRHGKQTAIHCGKEVKASQERLKIVHMNSSQEERAWDLFCRFKDKDYDLVDCLSFICMKDLQIEEAFAFDRHFVQYGFQLAV